jgi:hypothetical protein
MVASDDIGAEVATLLTGPAWSGDRVIELGSMVSADEVAAQLGEVLKLDVKAFALPRAAWADAFQQFGVPKGHTGPAEEMYESVNAGWMDLRIRDTEHVSGTTSARDVFCGCTERRQGVSPGKLDDPGSVNTCSGARGWTGQLTVRFHAVERPSRHDRKNKKEILLL